jgi:hypothetical protein
VKARARFAAAFILFTVSVFPETIDPPPLKVRQVCGQAFPADVRIEVRQQPLGEVVASATTNDQGEFFFSQLPHGRLYLALPGLALHDYYPIELQSPLSANMCKKPLFVKPRTGSESGIIVSFKRD